jgi:hypothetical protein
MTIEAVRPFRSGIPEHVTLQKGTLTNVLYAAGSSEAAPRSGNCGAWLTLLNHHDLASAGLTNHVTVDLFDRPPAVPAAAAFGRMQLGCCASLQWRVQDSSVALRLDAIVANGTTPGWLGLGFSPGGTMAAGDFIVGYAGADRPCVRALSSSSEGRPPAEPQPFELANASFSISGRMMTLSATRPLKSVVQGHVELGVGAVNVLYAAGSRTVVPWGCGNALNLLNHHDLGYLVGAAVVGIALRQSRPGRRLLVRTGSVRCASTFTTRLLTLCWVVPRLLRLAKQLLAPPSRICQRPGFAQFVGRQSPRMYLQSTLRRGGNCGCMSTMELTSIKKLNSVA